MVWTARRSRTGERARDTGLVVHRGAVVWLWCAQHRSETYDPSTDRWAPFETPFGDGGTREGSVIASIGDELVVWSGAAKPYLYSSSRGPVSGGTRLRADGTWQPMATKQQPSARTYARHAWTGRELIVWGGHKKQDGAAYDPATNTWRKLSKQGAATIGNGDTIWSGTELWTWGGATFAARKGLTAYSAGFAYDPAADRWRNLAPVPGKRDELANARALVRLGDSALFVRRDEGNDVGTCSAWRYEARADLWEPCTPPPEVQNNDPKFVVCDDRIVLKLGTELFEYVAARDAWAKLPSLHDEAWRARVVWLAGALYAFEDHAVHRLVLPDAPDVIAPVATGVTVAAPQRAKAQPGSPVTAIAIQDDEALVGHLDGAVRRGGQELRAADGARILGLAVHDATWLCLIERCLEVHDGKRVTPIKLPWQAHMFAHHGDTIVIAGDGRLLPVRSTKGKWTAGKAVSVEGTTIDLALGPDGLARVVLGPPKGRGRKLPDTVELRDAKLAVKLSVAPRVERGTASAVPTADGVLVAGGGSYAAERYAKGKKRPVDKLSTSSAWASPIVRSADAAWLLARHAGHGVELYELATGRRELELTPYDDDDEDGEYEALKALHPGPVFLPEAEREDFVENTRYAGPTTALAISHDGKTLAFGMTNGDAFVIDRDTLGVTQVPARGEPFVRQPPAGRVVGRFKMLAVSPDHARGCVCVIRASDHRYGELAATGEWTWGPVLPAKQLAALREYDFSILSVHRRGSLLAVTGTATAVFEHETGAACAPAPDSERRYLYETEAKPDPHVVAIDVITRERHPQVAIPFDPHDAPIELGRGRLFVNESESYVVDLAGGRAGRVDFDRPVPSLDDLHFCVPEGPHGPFRRWKIYGADLAEPVAKLETYVPISRLAMLPNGMFVGSGHHQLVLFDANRQLVGRWRGLVDTDELVASGNGFVTWDLDGTFRSWKTQTTS